MQRPAFVIIDMQREWLEDPKRPVHGLGDALAVIAYVAERFRAASLPVIHVLDEDSVRPGDPGFEVVPQIKIDPLDRKVHKPHGNAFKDTKFIGMGLTLDVILNAGMKNDISLFRADYRAAVPAEFDPVVDAIFQQNHHFDAPGS